MIRYFISYRYYSDRQEGFGCLDTDTSEPIRSIEDIRTISDWIIANLKDEYEEPFKKAVILNWKRFEEDSYPAPPADHGQRLYEACTRWREQHQPTCGESIYQVDKVNEALPELVEELMDIVGYYNEEEEEEE